MQYETVSASIRRLTDSLTRGLAGLDSQPVRDLDVQASIEGDRSRLPFLERACRGHRGCVSCMHARPSLSVSLYKYAHAKCMYV